MNGRTSNSLPAPAAESSLDAVRSHFAMARPVAFAFVALLLANIACERPPLTPNGVVAAFGSTGLSPGTFNYPRAIATEPDGSVFVVDKSGRIQRFSVAGTCETVWKMPEVKAGKPVGMVVHPDGRLFIADTHYHRVVVTDRDGNILTTFGEMGTGDGQFQLPTDVAVDADGFVYVSEYHVNDRVTKWSPALAFVASLTDGPIDGKRLRRPSALAIDDEQTLWVADSCNHRIIRLTLSGDVLAVFGSLGDDPGQLRYPYDIDVSPKGEILVCEYGGNRLQWFTRDGRSVRVWGRAGRALGELFAPWGAAYGADDLVYIVDAKNNRVQILRP